MDEPLRYPNAQPFNSLNIHSFRSLPRAIAILAVANAPDRFDWRGSLE
jgi:hypothetical protein